jgi:hypothetical protein
MGMTDEDRRRLKGTGTTVDMGITDEDRCRPKGTGITIDPLTLTISDAQRFSGLSRSEIYRRLADCSIQAVKSGSRTLILTASLRAHIEKMPLATFRAPSQMTAP